MCGSECGAIVRERRDQRANHSGEMVVDFRSFLGGKSPVVDDMDAGGSESRQHPPAPVHLDPVHKALYHRLDDHSARRIASDFGCADPDEVVQMRAHDREELDAFEQRRRFVACLLEHPLLKPEKAQFAVVEQQGVAAEIRRGVALGQQRIRFARISAERCAVWCSSSRDRMTRETNGRRGVRPHWYTQRLRWQTTYQRLETHRWCLDTREIETATPKPRDASSHF